MFRTESSENETVIANSKKAAVPLRERKASSINNNKHGTSVMNTTSVNKKPATTKSSSATQTEQDGKSTTNQLQLEQRLVFQSEYYNRKLIVMRQEAEFELRLAKWVLESNNHQNQKEKENDDDRVEKKKQPQTHQYDDQSLQLERMRRELHAETNALREFHKELSSEYAKKEQSLEQERKSWKEREYELLNEIRELKKNNNTSSIIAATSTTPPPTSSYVRFDPSVLTSSTNINTPTASSKIQESKKMFSNTTTTTTPVNANKYLILANHHHRNIVTKQKQQHRVVHDDDDDAEFIGDTPSPLSTVGARSISENHHQKRSSSGKVFDELSDDEDVLMTHHGSPLSPNSMAML